MYVDHEDATFSGIVGWVWNIIKRQRWIVIVWPFLQATNVLEITKNRKREGPEVSCRLIKIIAYML